MRAAVSIRIIHLLLAVFTASAANKFFIPDLEFELEHRFYARIFDFQGDAPDQYRIIPLLVLKEIWMLLDWLRPGSPWNHAVLLFNFGCAFLLFEGFFRLLGHWPVQCRLVFNLLFASLFIYTQYTGWRPDTLGLEVVCLANVLAWALFPRALILHGLLLAALAFSRSEIAMVFALFHFFYVKKNYWTGLLFAAIPVAAQLLLQFYLFPDARYYTKTLMLADNLGGFYLAYNPATWGLLAAFFIFFNKIKQYLGALWISHKYLLLLCLTYLLLVLFVGRLNEYRLYLPFLPLFLFAGAQRNSPKSSLP